MKSWTKFAQNLGISLRRVSDRAFLVVSVAERPGVFVQFAGGPGELHAEARDTGDPAVLAAAGWHPPDAGFDNWYLELPLPALTAEYLDLAERCVAALCDGFGVPAPDDLVYRAWREPEPVPPGEQRAGRDKGENPLWMPMLGVRTERR